MGGVSPPRPAGRDQAWAEYAAALQPIAEAEQAAREQLAAHARQLAEALAAADTELRRVAGRRGTVEGQLGKITEFTRTTLAESDVSPTGLGRASPWVSCSPWMTWVAPSCS